MKNRRGTIHRLFSVIYVTLSKTDSVGDVRLQESHRWALTSLSRIAVISLIVVFISLCQLEAGRVYVHGYTRKDGTFVKPHYRNSPDSGSNSAKSFTPYIGDNNGSISSGNMAGTPYLADVPRKAPAVQEDPEVVAKYRNKILEGVVAWQMEKAEAGSDSAQCAIGMRYLKGDGLAQSETIGRTWLVESAKQGNSDAYDVLKNVDFEVPFKDKSNRVIQSTSARREFLVKSGYPKGRIGHVIDHIVPIEKGGADVVGNLYWASYKEAREKETWDLLVPIPLKYEKTDDVVEKK
jgi:hypothetical protein